MGSNVIPDGGGRYIVIPPPIRGIGPGVLDHDGNISGSVILVGFQINQAGVVLIQCRGKESGIHTEIPPPVFGVSAGVVHHDHGITWATAFVFVPFNVDQAGTVPLQQHPDIGCGLTEEPPIGFGIHSAVVDIRGGETEGIGALDFEVNEPGTV